MRRGALKETNKKDVIVDSAGILLSLCGLGKSVTSSLSSDYAVFCFRGPLIEKMGREAVVAYVWSAGRSGQLRYFNGADHDMYASRDTQTKDASQHMGYPPWLCRKAGLFRLFCATSYGRAADFDIPPTDRDRDALHTKEVIVNV